ncbi:MAG: hypothetical protein Fur0021_17740 [Candidatus Promineifilaceae bacterium]
MQPWQTQQKVSLVTWLTLALLLSACAANDTPIPPATVIATQVIAAATTTPVPTITSTNTATLPPIPTATATNTPSPSATLSPTPTPTATYTPTSLPTLTPTPTDTPIPLPTPVPILPIGEIPNQLGNEVTVAGQVVATASFAGGYKFTISDTTGQVTLLMWSNVYDDCWDAPILNLGATVTATGLAGQFEGEWQVEPDFGGDVKVTAPGSQPPVQAIGSLGDYMSQRVAIEGQINRVEGTNSGAKLFVADNSGEILVFIWNNTLERIANNQALGAPGTRVRVVGYVQEFRSNREIVPTLPYDVTVLP